ncbi:hypothetical protein I302_101554 [Kwoniella bestiolae CBS 10118]|uniref:Uncharacterized protein n=1 Tax=Kwoniella bestiolae CBS 10118 TaxID=1296100 RepID=A0A1B9GCK6_9TREE|nr:hypothetical protein I302_00238 [Kwoniella bestiolae CBS 10118]OCF28749.1 hypothetical protein I302_00238 [Kwoniella bestiolae CBS 10118]
MLKDIVERPSKAPSTPSAPAPGGVGFPIAVHRSQRPSAFAKSRQQQAARQAGVGSKAVGEGRAVDIIPSIGISPRQDEGPSAQGQLSEMEEVRRSVEAENTKRVEGMSNAEREEEVEELKERFGSGLMELMRKRKETREGKKPENVGDMMGDINESGPSSRPFDMTDAQKILDEVSEENRRKVESMDNLEREQEVEELQERFGGKLIEALRRRAEARAGKGKGKEEVGQAQSIPSMSRSSGPTPSASTRLPSSSYKPKPKFKPHTHPDDPSLSELKAYFPSVPAESSKLAWLQPLSPSSTSSTNSPRFDLSGNILSSSEQNELPSHLGLHHHGSSPDLAGYTIQEILYLCRSTVPSQKITMMGILAKCLSKLRNGEYSEEARKELEAEECTKKAIELGVEILAGLSRGIGVIESGIDLLFMALDSSSWTWFSEEIDWPARFTVDEGVLAIPFEDVLPRMKELLAIEDGLSSITIWQLLQILRRATYISKDLCETICSIVPSVIKVQVISKPWPPSSSTNKAGQVYPSIEGLKLLKEIVTSSRECAEDLVKVNQQMFEGILKFVVTATWENDGSDPDSVYASYSHGLAIEVLEIFMVLGKYGLSSNTLASSAELWYTLGKWVNKTSSGQYLSQEEIRLVEGYFGLMEVWITCAIDPHRTTPEHDLTWAQVNAMNYQDEAVSVIQTSKEPAIIASALDMLCAWSKGVKVNGVKGGEEEKGSLLSSLSETSLEELVVGSSEKAERVTVEDRLVAAAVQLHRLLLPSGQLLSSGTIEKIRSLLFDSPAPSTRHITHARYELLLVSLPNPISQEWISQAFDLFQHFQIGDEPLALDLLDVILKSDLSTLLPEIKELNHPDGIQILRPLLQYAILPNVESVIAPSQPTHQYLKATSTLRPPAVVESKEKPALPGLSLGEDWFFSPLNELLRSGTSEALQQIPQDWSATEVQITQATLLLAKLRYHNGVRGLDRARLIFGLMKVHMLEHGQTSSNAVGEVEVFRDGTVGGLMRDLMGLVLVHQSTSQDQEEEIHGKGQDMSGELERISIPFLGSGVPFFQFYQDFLGLYESISFSDPLFTQLFMPVLSMNYSRDYRRLLWVEHHPLLKNIRTPLNHVPLLSGTGMEVYYNPLEGDQEILTSYARALISEVITKERNEFMWSIAIHHLAGLFWLGTEVEKDSKRVGLLIMILANGSDRVVGSLLGWDLDRRVEGVKEEEKGRRREVLRDLSGDRGMRRIEGL